MTNSVENKFELAEIEEAYKKLKHYYYFDNTSLFIRKRISDFESDGEIEKKLKNLCQYLNQENSSTLESLIETISYKTTPKSIEKETYDFVTNRIKKAPLKLKKVNIFIDAPVELHIISTLWLMNAGVILDQEIPTENYAYKLQLNNEESENEDGKVVNGLKLYKPYFIQYQQWRDNAIEIAEEQLKRNNDVVILNLDVKDYFHSVKIDLNFIQNILHKQKPETKNNHKIHTLFRWLGKIHDKYKEVLASVIIIDEEATETPLPIGLVSSGLLGNLYLSQFDKKIKQELNPIYYGRYVDDILLVISNPVFNYESFSPVHTFLKHYFINKNILSYTNSIDQSLENLLESDIPKINSDFKYINQNKARNEDSKQNQEELKKRAEDIEYKIYDNLFIQGSKVKLQHFDKRESRAAINKFKKNLEKNRSEFRFLPEEESVNAEFDEEAFSIYYTDSVNKLRSIKELSEDKYGASKFLAKKIFNSLYTKDGDDPKTTRQILTFFKGEVAITFHTLWEKVATYFIINDQFKELKIFISQIIFSIEQLQNKLTDNYKKDKSKVKNQRFFNKIKEDLMDYLDIAIAMPSALNPDFLRKVLSSRKNIERYAISFRLSNMLRHNYVPIPLLNYTNYSTPRSNKFNNLLNSNLENLNTPKNKLATLDKRLLKYSPRFVHYHECTLLHIQKAILEFQSTRDLYTAITDDGGYLQITDCFSDTLNTSFDLFWTINYEWKYPSHQSDSFRKQLKKKYFESTYHDDYIDWRVSSIYKGKEESLLNRTKNFPNIKAAIANINIEKNNVRDSYLGEPNTGKFRRKILFDLLNQAENEKSNIFILPEVSIPYSWLKLLPHQSYRRDMAIVAGLEHWVNSKKFAFNFLVTVVPIRVDEYCSCLIKIRLKNHYSHEETRELIANHRKIPNKDQLRIFKKCKNDTLNEMNRFALEKLISPRRYDRFIWNGVYFSVYNCFELADINDRGLFKSKVDFIIASEYNKDTSYFSDIAGSWVRDIHCYFIQVNTSSYGDSRITRPSKTVTKDILQLKGGENATILTGKLHIKELREFQFVEYELQKDYSEQKPEKFKPTPPDFNKSEVEKRIKGK